MTHKTKGIILRTVKYGETSIIASVYTELFGIQSYIVKGIRQSNKKQNKAIYFQPAAMLEMVVYHNELKKLQFIKEYQWSYLYRAVLFDVVKNAIAMFMVELLQLTMKQPEANAELFYFIEDCLQQLDKGSNTLAANLPLYFTLNLATKSGFRLQGEYAETIAVLDLQEGAFVTDIPAHSYYAQGSVAFIISILNSLNSLNALEQIALNRSERKEVLLVLLQYISLHLHDAGNLKSLSILQEVLN